MECENCCRALLQNHDHVVLSPCGHCVCPKCWIATLMAKGKFSYHRCCLKRCPHQIVKSHSYNTWDIHSTCWLREETTHCAPQPKLTTDPLRYFNNLDETQQVGKIVVALATKLGPEAEPQYFTIDIDEEHGVKEEDQWKFISIFALLHRATFVSMNHDAVEDIPYMTPAEIRYFAIHDSRFLARVIHAFMTGSADREQDASNAAIHPTTRMKLFTSFVVTDVTLRQLNHWKPQRLQIMIANELSMIGETSELNELLTNFRLSSCRTTVRNKNYRYAVQHGGAGVQLDPRGFFNIPADNIEFKGKGYVDSWVNILLQYVSPDELKKQNFYHLDPTQRLSRDDGKDWKQLTDAGDKASLVDDVFLIQDKDYLLLSNRQLVHLNCVKGLDLPDAAKCKEINESEVFDCTESFPLNLGVVLPEREVAAQQELKEDERPTMYSRNNVSMMQPYHAPFSRKETLLEITRSALRTAENMREKRGANDGDDHPEGPPVQDLIVALCGDGYPVEQFIRVKAEAAAKGDASLNIVEWFGGGFHYKINAYRSLHGKLLRDIYGSFVREWRPGTRALDWILNCPDPKDAENETIQFLVSNYKNVAESLKKINGTCDVTAFEMHEHMKARAAEHPFCMAVFIHIKFLEILLILRDSEKSGSRGDVQLWLTATRFLLVIFAVCHSPKYLRLCCYFLRWWHCASSATRRLYERYLFTKQSPNGFPWFTDLFVEKLVRDIRRQAKDKVRPGMEAMMHSVVPRIPDIMKAKHLARSHHADDETDKASKSWNLRTSLIGKPYVKTYLMLEELNVWGSGPLTQKRDDSRDGNAFVMPDGGIMSSSLLRAPSIGVDRVTRYTLYHEVNRPFEEKRKDIVKITLLKAKAGAPALDMATNLTKHTSCIPKALTDLGLKLTVAEIVEELDAIRMEFAHVVEMIYNTKTKKAVLIDLLCKMRQIYFAHNPEALEDRRDICEADSGVETRTTHGERVKELATPFCSLHANATLL